MGRVHAAVLDAGAVALLHDTILTGEHLAEIRARLGHELATQQDRLSQHRAALRERQARLGREIANLTTAIAGGGAIAELVAEMQERTAERRSVAQQIADAEHERALQNPEIVSDDTWTAVIAWMREALESGPDAQRAHAVVRSLVQRLDVWSDKQGVTLHYYLGNVGGAASLGGTAGGVPAKPQYLIRTMECAQRLTRRGNQHGVCS